MFSFGSSFVISKVSVADFKRVFACWERYFTIAITFVVVLIIKHLTQQRIICSM